MAGIQVLHVDDEPDMRLLVKLSLDTDATISTRSAASGEEALDATAQWRPDVILLDAVMPGMDGLATLKALQANPRTAGIPVLFLTGKCDADDVAIFKAGGSAGIIAKPFDPRALVSAVRTFVQAGARDATDPQAAAMPGSPDFAGRSTKLEPAAVNAGTASSPGGVQGLGAADATRVLLLDNSGTAFALTITERGDVTGHPPAGAWAHHRPLARDTGSSEVEVHVAALDLPTVSDLLGMDATSLFSGPVDAPLGPDDATVGASAGPIGYAAGCHPSTAAGDLGGDARQPRLDVLQHAPSLVHALDWIAAVSPPGLLH